MFVIILIMLFRNNSGKQSEEVLVIPTPTIMIEQPVFLAKEKVENQVPGVTLDLPNNVKIYKYAHKAIAKETIESITTELGFDLVKDKVTSGIPGAIALFDSVKIASLLFVPDQGTVSYSGSLTAGSVGFEKASEEKIILQAQDLIKKSGWTDLPVAIWKKQYENRNEEAMETTTSKKGQFLRVWFTPQVENQPVLGIGGGLLMFLFNNKGELQQMKLDSPPVEIKMVGERELNKIGQIFWTEGWNIISNQVGTEDQAEGVRYYLGWMEEEKNKLLVPMVFGEKYVQSGSNNVFSLIAKSLIN